MKLKRFRVYNFRNVTDSGWVEMADILTLVGKNESGKTSILKALWKFNPSEEQPYSLEREWPRGRRKDRSPEQVVVETEFVFSDEEKASLARIHESAAGATGVNIKRNYKGSFFYTFRPTNVADEHDIKWVISIIKEKIGTVPEGASDHFKGQYNQAVEKFIQQVRDNDGSAYAVANAAAFKSSFASFYHPNNPQNNNQFQADQKVIVSLNKALDEAVEELKADPPLRQAIDTMHKWLPTFIYMDDYRIFTGSAQLDEVQRRFRENKAMEADDTIRLIMRQAGLDLDQEVEKGKSKEREQRMLDMNDASQTLTNEIANRWSQKKYEIRFEADGQQLIMFVKDVGSPALVPLEERSKGFQWFFSFDMLFMSETKGEFKNSLILLDEPGLHLHAAAQRDLLERMRAYARDNQLIYTTHMPFMVDATKLDTIYICEEKPREGVKVHQDWASAGNDARFTLQAALGLSWSQSLFVGRYNLVVEGVTDFWFLSTISEMFRQAGRDGMDEELVITPAGGASRVAYIGTILRGQELRVAVLLDSDLDGQSAYEQLVHQWILDDKHVLMIGRVLGAKGNRCLEDLFDEKYYVEHVKESYKKELVQCTVSLQQQDGQTVVQRVEAWLKTHGVETFNKGRVGKRIMRGLAGKSLDDLPADTVERFGKVITEINNIVAKWRKEERSS